MPLKHNTETWLLFLLGLVTVLTGLLCAFLPPVTVAWWPWAIAFVAAIAYPFLLYPLFKARRADYPFRMLHFAPAVLLLVWLAADLAAGMWPAVSGVQEWVTWKGTLIPVALIFALLVWFSLVVIRQRQSRIALLAGLLVLLGVAGFLTDTKEWNRQLAARVWGESGSLIANVPGSDVAEERWRAQLRLMEARRRAIVAGEQGSSGSTSSSSISKPAGALSGAVIAAGASSSISSVPQLPHAGPTAEVLVLLTTSGYCAALHRRTMKRLKA